MVKVVLGFEFKLACWYVTKVFVDVCWKCWCRPFSKLIICRNKVSLHRFVRWNSLSHFRICPNMCLWLSRMVIEIDFSLHFFLHRFVFLFTGYLMLRSCSRFFFWRDASSLASSVCVLAHVSPLYVRFVFTSAL